MKTTNLNSILLILLTLTLVNTSCKKEEEKPKKLNVTTQWRNLFDDKDNAPFTNNQEVPSGSTLIFKFDFGNNDGTGLQSVDVVRINSKGSKKCGYIKKGAGYSTIMEPVSENTSFVFTATIDDGTTSTFDTINVQVAKDKKLNIFSDGFDCYSNDVKKFFSKYYAGAAIEQVYEVTSLFNNNDFNGANIDFAITKAGDDLFFTSPNLFNSLNVLPEQNEQSCSYKKVLFQTYNGPIKITKGNLLTDYTETFDDLENEVKITTTDEKLKIVKGMHFMMQTEDGKKAVGYVNNIVNNTTVFFTILYQR